MDADAPIAQRGVQLFRNFSAFYTHDEEDVSSCKKVLSVCTVQVPCLPGDHAKNPAETSEKRCCLTLGPK